MEVFHDLSEMAVRNVAASVAIGNFDGVHKGHQALLKSTIERARAENFKPTVLTFFPHPVEVLQPQKKVEQLTTTSEKLCLLEKFGVEQVLVAKFDAKLAALTPEEFFRDFLIQGLRARSIHVGFNFCFGKNRQGNVETLKHLASQYAVTAEVAEQISENGERVSSSLIRARLRDGNLSDANRLLGRFYSLSGQVRPGDRRGRMLGFPTANVHCPHDKLLPKNGVYVARVRWQQETYRAVTNVGVRPTFIPAGAAVPGVEVHLLDFNSEIYDEFLEVEFLERLRDEKKFAGLDELKAQIARDVDAARRFKIPAGP